MIKNLKKNEVKNDLPDRLFRFAVRSVKFMRYLPTDPEFNNIRYQFSKSATSSGANYEEAQAGSSKADFIYKTEICLREMRESNYWLRIMDATISATKNENEELNYLLKESSELKKILGSIIVKSKANLLQK